MQYNFNFLQTVAHSVKLVCKGPPIYKIKAKILQKMYIFSTLKSLATKLQKITKVYIKKYIKLDI